MEILPVNDLDVALHNFVNKDDKMAFYSCLQYNLEETRVSVPLCIPQKLADILGVNFGDPCVYGYSILYAMVCACTVWNLILNLWSDGLINLLLGRINLVVILIL